MHAAPPRPGRRDRAGRRRSRSGRSPSPGYDPASASWKSTRSATPADSTLARAASSEASCVSKPMKRERSKAVAISTVECPWPEPTSATRAPRSSFSTTPSSAGSHSGTRRRGRRSDRRRRRRAGAASRGRPTECHHPCGRPRASAPGRTTSSRDVERGRQEHGALLVGEHRVVLGRQLVRLRLVVEGEVAARDLGVEPLAHVALVEARARGELVRAQRALAGERPVQAELVPGAHHDAGVRGRQIDQRPARQTPPWISLATAIFDLRVLVSVSRRHDCLQGPGGGRVSAVRIGPNVPPDSRPSRSRAPAGLAARAPRRRASAPSRACSTRSRPSRCSARSTTPCRRRPPFAVELVAASRGPQPTASGLALPVHRSIADPGATDIAIVPSLIVPKAPGSRAAIPSSSRGSSACTRRRRSSVPPAPARC